MAVMLSRPATASRPVWCALSSRLSLGFRFSPSRNATSRLRLPVLCEFGQHDVHLRIGQQVRLADLQRSPVLFGQPLDFDCERERVDERYAERDHAVIREKAGLASREGVQRMIGERLRAEGRVWRTANVLAARD